jgi:hypothetical protein
MPNASYYRKEAERCRVAAATTTDGAAAVRWLRIAKDYDALANVLAAEEQRLSQPGMTRLSMQQRPVQQQPVQQQPVQQQSKLEEC